MTRSRTVILATAFALCALQTTGCIVAWMPGCTPGDTPSSTACCAGCTCSNGACRPTDPGQGECHPGTPTPAPPAPTPPTPPPAQPTPPPTTPPTPPPKTPTPPPTPPPAQPTPPPAPTPKPKPGKADTYGNWYFVANGNSTVPSSSAQDPSWLDSAANTVSIAFIDPGELDERGAEGLPLAYEQHVKALTSKGLKVLFSIGGASFADRWSFLATASKARAAAAVCAGWAKKYGVGIEIDYEGPDGESAGWSVNQGVSKISTSFANLGVFIEEFRKHVPFGSGTLTMDMYASQGGAPCLSYFANRYLPGMPEQNPSYIKGGDPVGLKMKGLDWINIMVAGSDSFSTSKAFLDGYVGADAHVANQYNPVGISKALDASRATISLIASNHCHQYDSDLSQMVDYVRSQGVKGIMFWAVAPFGCVSPDNPLRVADWKCDCNDASPGLAAGKKALLK